MLLLDGRLVHSASDLNNFSECVHLTALDRAVAEGRLERPARDNGTAQLLATKGEEHEQRYLERLAGEFGNRLVAFYERPAPTAASYRDAEAHTVAAMERAADVIYQATFFDGTFLGRADFLRKIERPSGRWPWSYEVVDTKLALSPKPYFLVQLCNYSEHVARIQRSAPAEAAIVLGTGEERRFTLHEFEAYYRRLKRAYLENIAGEGDAYPLECSHCDLCRWRDACAARRDADDHLSLIANIRRDQIRKLEEGGVGTLGALANAPDDVRPRQLNAQTYATLRGQAAEQHRYRTCAEGIHSYSFRPMEDERCGLARLPRPAAGDVFFDIEGDPLYRPDRGLEYLWGLYLPDEDRYVAFWAEEPAKEQAAFEAFVDFIVERRQRYPDLHVYHYASYETTVLKRLMGRYGSREKEIDDFLFAGTFVDMLPIVRQSVWISQPSYSIKKVEALYGYERRTRTRGGDDSIVMFESWLQDHNAATLEDIRAYNEDDCRSTHALRQWLLRLREEWTVTHGTQLPWWSRERSEKPPAPEGNGLARTLLAGARAPDSISELRAWPEERRARWLLGHMLEYHRREQKPEWWEFFWRVEHPTELLDERHSIAELRLRADIPPVKGDREQTHTFTYEFPEQEHDFGVGDEPINPRTEKRAGRIVSLDDIGRTVALKVSKELDNAPGSLRSLIPRGPIDDKTKRAAMTYIADSYRNGTLEQTHPATVQLLLNRAPRLRGYRQGATLQPTHVTNTTLSGLVQGLDRSYLVVQGPPGSGKTTRAAHVVVDLLERDKRVAVAAFTHKALHNLLHKIEDVAERRGVRFEGCHKSTHHKPESVYASNLAAPMVLDAPGSFAGCQLVSATTFSWAADSQRESFDTVLIDEAGQVSLADALITSLVAQNIVLIGDPQQLAQVAKGSHPVGTDLSILQHLLEEHATIPAERGIFLDVTYRLHPDIDRFVSQTFYDDRLKADPPNARNAVASACMQGGGTRWLAVDHDGNRRRSYEEAQVVVDEIVRLLDGGAVTIRDDASRPLTAHDILVVAPYNRQRVEITQRLQDRGLGEVRVGTVDKFQGQEAPVVFYSMATSRAELAPRGLDFLLSPNRLNVAVSRAQAISALVCSPHLLASRAMTIEQMRLLNRLCAYAEDAAAPALRDGPPISALLLREPIAVA